jgi:L-ascorbate metabolism protein UlaG (beta-lactamase superfamily)
MSSTQIQYLGHSTVVIRHETNLGIVIDPWLEGNPSCPDAFKNLDDIKIIILTHGHADHTSSAAELAKKTGAVIFATYELAMLMGAEGVAKEQLQPMNKGGCVKDKSGTKISLTHAMHSSSFVLSLIHKSATLKLISQKPKL